MNQINTLKSTHRHFISSSSSTKNWKLVYKSLKYGCKSDIHNIEYRLTIPGSKELSMWFKWYLRREGKPRRQTETLKLDSGFIIYTETFQWYKQWKGQMAPRTISQSKHEVNLKNSFRKILLNFEIFNSNQMDKKENAWHPSTVYLI